MPYSSYLSWHFHDMKRSIQTLHFSVKVEGLGKCAEVVAAAWAWQLDLDHGDPKIRGTETHPKSEIISNTLKSLGTYKLRAKNKTENRDGWWWMIAVFWWTFSIASLQSIYTYTARSLCWIMTTLNICWVVSPPQPIINQPSFINLHHF